MGFNYNEKVLSHFLEPHNIGFMQAADGVGRLGDASCGDVFVMFARVENDRLADIRYLVRGCGAAIATCSALSDIARGLTIAEAERLTDDDIARELGGLPLEKMHCSNLAATVLKWAIEDCRRRAGERKAKAANLQDWRAPYRAAMHKPEEVDL